MHVRISSCMWNVLMIVSSAKLPQRHLHLPVPPCSLGVGKSVGCSHAGKTTVTNYTPTINVALHYSSIINRHRNSNRHPSCQFPECTCEPAGCVKFLNVMFIQPLWYNVAVTPRVSKSTKVWLLYRLGLGTHALVSIRAFEIITVLWDGSVVPHMCLRAVQG